MTPEQWQKVSAVLDQILDQTDTDRASFLARLRIEDPDAYREVESLLEQQQATAVLQAPPAHLFNEVTPTLAGLGKEPSPAPLPTRAGRYLIQQEIARGGMGAILRAFDPEIERALAIKVLLPEASAYPDAELRFLREAQITGRLQHPGIPPVHELGRLEDGRPFFAMKLIEGKTLTALISARDFVKGDAKFISIFEQICRTLAYAHNQGIIHRDLKPSNIMVGAFGEVQVMDWGLAKRLPQDRQSDGVTDAGPTLATDDSFTRAGSVSGTPAYMAPEQARGDTEQIDERSDVFGLGGILCVLLTGRPPFLGASQDVLASAARGDLADAFAILYRAHADPALVAIAMRCLAPAKESRYRNAADLADAVTHYREDVQEKLRQAELAREKAQVQAQAERRRRRLAWTLAGALVLLLLGAAVVGFWYQQTESARLVRAQNLNHQLRQSLDDAEAERQRLHARLRDRQDVQRLLSDLRPWRDSLSATQTLVKHARKLADSDPQQVESEIGVRLAALERTLEDDLRAETFTRAVDALRLQTFHLDAKGSSTWLSAAFKEKEDKASAIDLIALNQKYAQAFARHGWTVMEDDLDRLASQMRASPLRYIAVAALDNWAWTAVSRKPADEATVKRVLDLARRVDPEPWCDEFRQWDVWSSPKRCAEYLRRMPVQQSPQILAAAANLQRQHGASPLALIRTSLGHHPGNFWLNFYLAWDVRHDNVDEAISAYRTALVIRPDDPVVLSNLAFLLRQKGDFDAAVRHYEQALAQDEKYANARCGLASCYLARKDFARSIEHYKKALAAQPDHPAIHNDIAVAYFINQEYDRADEHLTTALKIDPTYTQARHGRAINLRQQAKYAEALNEMRVAHEAEPTKFRAAFITEYGWILNLSQKEPQTPVDLKTLEAGLSGKLTSEHPNDIYAPSLQSYRASHCVALSAGKTYQIDLTSTDFDPFLRIEDARYNLLLYNDDVRYPDILDSRILFTPTRAGIYRLVATSFKGQSTGSYQLKVSEVVPQGEPIIIQGTLSRQDKKTQAGGHYKRHPVTLPADVPCTIILDSKDFNTKIQLVDESGKTSLGVNESMHWERLRHSRLDITLGKASPYQVLAISAEPERVGSYTITIQRFAPLR